MTKTKLLESYDLFIKAIITVPGLVALTKPNSESQEHLAEGEMSKGIKVIETPRGIEIKVFIISSINVRAETVSREITSSIRYICKNKNIKLSSVNIFIRGVN